MKHTEVELKIKLSYDQYLYFLNCTGSTGTHHSFTYYHAYFDINGGEFQASRRMLRHTMIHPGPSFVTTFKGKSSTKDGVQTASEQEEVSRFGFLFYADPTQEHMINAFKHELIQKNFPIKDGDGLYLINQEPLINIRKKFYHEPSSLDIELDQTFFPGGVEYELECEFDPDSPEQVDRIESLKEIIKKETGSMEYQTEGKFARLLKKINK